MTVLIDAPAKWCASCSTTQPLENFHKNSSARDGLQSYCKPCHIRITTNHRQTPVGRRYKRNAHLVAAYGLTIDDYNVLLEAQGGGCAICGTSPKAKYLAVDHDHETGVVRGLLCSNCNVALGMLNEDVRLMEAMTTYIEKIR